MKRLIALFLLILAWPRLDARPRPVRRPTPDTAVNVRGDAGRSGVLDARGPRSFSRIAWQTRMSPSFGTPLYANGTIYAPDGAGHVRAIDPSNGQSRWVSPALGNILTGAAATPGAVFVGSERNAVTALDPNSGATLWAFTADSEVFAYPAIANGVLYVATERGSVYAVDLQTHGQKWQYSTTAPIHGQPVVNENVVVIGTDNVIAIDSAGGQELWRSGSFGHQVETYSARNGVLYVGASGFLIAYEIHTGRELWRRSVDGATAVYSIVILNGVLYVADDRPMIASYDASSGTELKAFRPSNFFSGLSIADGIVYAGVFAPNSTNPNVQRTVYALDVNTLTPLWTATIAGDVQQTATAADGRVFILATNGTLYALE